MRKIKVLGIPFDFGQPHSGVRKSANYLRGKGLIKLLGNFTTVEDKGDLIFPLKFQENGSPQIKHEISSSSGNEKISNAIFEMDLEESFLLNVGGDHGLGLGSIHGILAHRPDTVVIWADAHGDINTPETSPSGNFHGMPLTFLLGLASNENFSWIRRKLLSEKLIFFGPRDLDEGEKALIEKHSIQYFSSDEINRVGTQEILSMALHRADPLGQCPIHLSFDVDVFDQKDISSTGTKVPAGPHLEELFLLGGLLADTGRLRSMDIVEFNPEIGTPEEVESSSALILEFLDSTLRQVMRFHERRIYRALPQNYFTAGIA